MIYHLPTILVIDDDPIVRQTIKALLTGDDVRLVFAEDGKSGIEIAQKLQPDAILLDVMMPGMNGYEVCQILRQDPNLNEVHIVMLTSLDDRDARLTGFMAGVDDFITKPFDRLELHLRLKTITRINRYRRLMAERARFSWIVENNNDGYLLLSSDGIIQYANSSAQTFLHLPHECAGIDITPHILKHYSPYPLDIWDEWLKTPAPCYLVQTETLNARAYWLLLEAIDMPVKSDNSRVVRVRDVTETMSTHHDMRKFHKAVTHKLRSPFSTLVMSMSMLENKLQTISEDEIKEFVRLSMDSINYLTRDVNRVLDYIDTPLAMESSIPLEIRSLPEIIKSAQVELGLNDIQLTIHPGLSASCLAITDYAFELVLGELLENSKKFHPEQTPRIEIMVEPVGMENMIQVAVKDDGIRLTAEQLNWARLPYFQGEKFFTGETPGMGLGLPTVTSIIWQVGGQVTISNRADCPGVVVSLSIPLADDG